MAPDKALFLSMFYSTNPDLFNCYYTVIHSFFQCANRQKQTERRMNRLSAWPPLVHMWNTALQQFRWKQRTFLYGTQCPRGMFECLYSIYVLRRPKSDTIIEKTSNIFLTYADHLKNRSDGRRFSFEGRYQHGAEKHHRHRRGRSRPGRSGFHVHPKPPQVIRRQQNAPPK